MKSSYWSLKSKIPKVIVYYVSSDVAYNDDDGTISTFDTEEEFVEWSSIEYANQVYTGFNIYAVFRIK